MSEKPIVLYLCIGNSCRSQMAEGWTRFLKGDEINALSAGIETHGLNPNAVKVMAEVGIDIAGQRSQNIAKFAEKGASEEEQLNCYRAVRDEIKTFVETLPESLNNEYRNMSC